MPTRRTSEEEEDYHNNGEEDCAAASAPASAVAAAAAATAAATAPRRMPLRCAAATGMAWFIVQKVTHHHRIRYLDQWGAGRFVLRDRQNLRMGFERCDLLCSQVCSPTTSMSSMSTSSPSCCIEHGKIAR